MIIYDFEVFKHDWLVCWLDTKTRKLHAIVNDVGALHRMYKYYGSEIWVGYNSRGYDQYILKGILCGFDPFEISHWIIKEKRKGWEFSKSLSQYNIYNYDCSVGFRSLKELEAFMGHDIRESNVPFDIDRKLTNDEIQETVKYCKHDVMECFHVFLETKSEYESHIGLLKEFTLPLKYINKTKVQLSAIILGAERKKHDDEFELDFAPTMQLGEYRWIRDWYKNWSDNVRDYSQMTLSTDINGVPHTFGIGGLHGSVDNYIGEGLYLMADVGSYYPALMIEYDWLSRNVKNKGKFKVIRDERLIMKAKKDPRQQPRKIVLNGTYGASKDVFNNLYDPKMANNVCVNGQLFLVDLLEKLKGLCQLIQSNTDGVLLKIINPSDYDTVIGICDEWCKRTRMELEFDKYTKVIQRDVNNYIIVGEDGSVKRKGGVVKKLSPLDNNLPIVNKAVVDYFVKGTPPEQTVNASTKLIDFQFITKISSLYDFGFKEEVGGKPKTFIKTVSDKKSPNGYKVIEEVKYGHVLHEKVHRCFASIDQKDGALYKKHSEKTSLDKTAGTPEHCFIINENILEMEIPMKLDRQWYIDEAKERISSFIGGK